MSDGELSWLGGDCMQGREGEESAPSGLSPSARHRLMGTNLPLCWKITTNSPAVETWFCQAAGVWGIGMQGFWEKNWWQRRERREGWRRSWC